MIPTCRYDTTQSHTVCFCIWALRKVIQLKIHLRNFSVRKIHAEQAKRLQGPHRTPQQQ